MSGGGEGQGCLQSLSESGPDQGSCTAGWPWAPTWAGAVQAWHKEQAAGWHWENHHMQMYADVCRSLQLCRPALWSLGRRCTAPPWLPPLLVPGSFWPPCSSLSAPRPSPLGMTAPRSDKTGIPPYPERLAAAPAQAQRPDCLPSGPHSSWSGRGRALPWGRLPTQWEATFLGLGLSWSRV